MTTDVSRLASSLAERYRIERELGQGGMATVYLAEDLKHKRKVALKVLKPELAAVLGAERFVQEITTTASLQHPHILPLFDSGAADGFLFYVMPFIDGETLRAKLDLDSRSMYFMGNNKGSHLYRVDPSGAALAEQVMTFPGLGLVRTPVLDPAGESVFFTRGREGADELVQMKLSGTQPVVVPGGRRAFAPQISPDGRWLAFLSNASARTELHVRSTDLTRSGDWRVATSADLDGKPRWSRGGDELFYVANGSLMAVRVTASPSFEAGLPRALFSTAGLDLGFDVGADGRFLMIRRRPDRRHPTSLVMLERWTDLLPDDRRRGTAARRKPFVAPPRSRA